MTSCYIWDKGGATDSQNFHWPASNSKHNTASRLTRRISMFSIIASVLNTYDNGLSQGVLA